nr:MAG TPA: hypothetical protein [Caudoviricetes sp.]
MTILSHVCPPYLHRPGRHKVYKKNESKIILTIRLFVRHIITEIHRNEPI